MWEEYFKCPECKTRYYMYEKGRASIVYHKGQKGCYSCEKKNAKVKEEYPQIEYSHWVYKKGIGWETVQDNGA